MTTETIMQTASETADDIIERNAAIVNDIANDPYVQHVTDRRFFDLQGRYVSAELDPENVDWRIELYNHVAEKFNAEHWLAEQALVQCQNSVVEERVARGEA